MKDFTIKTYKLLLKTLQIQGYFFQTFSQFLDKPQGKLILLRHDVDKLPQNALRFAQIEHKLGVKGTYYFRIVPESFDPKIIEKIASLDHEIGYHYEDLHLAYKKTGNSQSVTRLVSHSETKADNPEQVFNLSIDLFKKHLYQFRKYYPIQTICMHGSPLSKFDNKLLWKYYDYKAFGIIGEPYFDANFDEMFYITDTGRRWNGGNVSVRDKGLGIRKQGLGKMDKKLGVPYHVWKVKPKVGSLMRMTEKGVEFQSRYNFKSTNDIIRAVENGELPDKAMMTFHPQRWNDRLFPWTKELVWQNAKNVAKYFLIKVRK